MILLIDVIPSRLERWFQFRQSDEGGRERRNFDIRSARRLYKMKICGLWVKVLANRAKRIYLIGKRLSNP